MEPGERVIARISFEVVDGETFQKEVSKLHVSTYDFGRKRSMENLLHWLRQNTRNLAGDQNLNEVSVIERKP